MAKACCLQCVLHQSLWQPGGFSWSSFPPLARGEVCIHPATFITLDITTGACPCALQPQSQRKAEGGQSCNWREMSVLSGNVKIWMVCLSWDRACVCGGIRAIFFLLSVVSQSRSSSWVLLDSGVTQWWQSSKVFHNLSYIGCTFSAATPYLLPCLLW